MSDRQRTETYVRFVPQRTARGRRRVWLPTVCTGFDGAVVWLAGALTAEGIVQHHTTWWQTLAAFALGGSFTEAVYALLVALAAYLTVDVE